jgi:hypothetical protein
MIWVLLILEALPYLAGAAFVLLGLGIMWRFWRRMI